MKLPVECFGADVHNRKLANLRNNKFFLLDNEGGVDTRVSGDPVAADDVNDDDDDDDCTCVACVRKDGGPL